MVKLTKSEIDLELRARGVLALSEIIIAQQTELARMQDILQGYERRLAMLETVQFKVAAIATEGRTELVDTLTLDAKFPLLKQDGFHDQEYDGRGVAYTWTGPEPVFRFLLYIGRDRAKMLTLNVMNFSLGPKVEIAPRLDGRTAEWKDSDKLGVYTAHELALPAEPGREMPTLLEIAVSKMKRPQEENPASKDSRTLGVAFHSLVVA